jgi:sugar/nucleoside kinase (ribokinase family)
VTSPKKYDILVAGEINPDLVLSGNVIPEFGQVEKLVDAANLTVGSSSAIFACAAARLGLKVGFIGVCGDDLFGRFMLEELRSRGVDTSPVIVRGEEQTGLSVILTRGADRAILTYLGLIGALKAGDIPEKLLASGGHLHVASYFLQTRLQAGLPTLFKKAQTVGMTTSLDTNWDPSGKWRGVKTLLKSVNVFLPNQAEARAITGRDDLVKCAQDLGGKSRVVIVKCGAEGAFAQIGGQIVKVSGLKLNVVDTIGAGDTFDAGFLYGYLRGWDTSRSLRLAVACGSLSTRSAGGVAAQPNLEEALKYV